MEFDTPTAGGGAPFACYNRTYTSGEKMYSSNFMGFIGGTSSQTAKAAQTGCP